MKKAFLAIAIVSISFAACNGDDTKTNEVTNSDTSTVVTQDTSMVVTDTTVKTTVTTDTVAVDKMNDNTDAKKDTTKNK